VISCRNIILVGCGGTGGFIAQCLAKSTKRPVVLVDGDTFEKKNLDRQLHDTSVIGKNKAEVRHAVFAETASCKMSFVPKYLDVNFKPEKYPLFMCAVDNHPARKLCLGLADEYKGCAIITGNETIDAEAYFYEYKWKDSPHDPRVYYPDINTNHSGDPLMPCTGDALLTNPQLAIANMMSASLAMWLFHFWFMTRPDKANSDLFPVRAIATGSKIRTITMGDMA